ncbi:hypothetical protein [Streptomyces sp. RerS4]|uniref:hypothetical protein n=1 Tax=Streptomyces sp. RerS4 TaxID=2942449 RepID=UPI00201C79A7|nr:hypothetical protein [Streptomyces sp. RerS4]UQX03675.1 hypothetical protein M4D82_26670 [Streptomyces sp. RerS4]
MIRFEGPAPERQVYPLRPLLGAEGKATFSVSTAVLDLLGLNPADAAALDLGDVFRLMPVEGK